MTTHPFPLEPLLAASGLDVFQLAVAVGVHPTTVHRRLHQGLDERRADRWACAVSLPAAFVWGEAYWRAALTDDEQAAVAS